MSSERASALQAQAQVPESGTEAEAYPAPPKRPRPVSTNQNMSNQAAGRRPSYSTQDDDDIQEVVPVKSDPRDPPPQPLIPDERQQQAVYQEDQGMLGGQDQGTVALDDTYADESYDYGQYGYDDGSGLMDPNSGMPMEGDGNKDLAIIESKMLRVSNAALKVMEIKIWQLLS